jgi:hypothetical protein
MIEDNIIQGNPTKTFFIQMITRDITINDAIIDLLDNSIDGANKLKPIGDYSGLFIDITINQDEFIVKDNCGGFPLNVAQKYAFRFGRPDDAPETIGSVGRFGIGMKRALFKIGKNFVVESQSEDNHFKIMVDVDEWKGQTRTITLNTNETRDVEDWNFKYEIVSDSRNLSENGTYIKVWSLTNDVSDLFNDEVFLNDLRDDIERLLNFSLQKKIKITLNGQELSCKGIELFYSEDGTKPYYNSGYHTSGVDYKIIAGLGKVGDPSLSGWYIYCNDRLVLEADTSEITGWGTPSIPKFHIDHVMFRGIVFLDSKDTIKLPLTTTKKGIDATSEVYKAILTFMKEAMQQVITFLKTVTKLGDEANNYRKLLEEQAEKKSVVEMKAFQFSHTIRDFIEPDIDMDIIAQKKDTVRIAYDVNKNIANKAKCHSESKSYKELGETTFNYYIQMEELKDE